MSLPTLVIAAFIVAGGGTSRMIIASVAVFSYLSLEIQQRWALEDRLEMLEKKML